MRPRALLVGIVSANKVDGELEVSLKDPKLLGIIVRTLAGGR
jgi:hypothetical protein